MDLQTIIRNLAHYWAGQGCIPLLPYDIEVGAGTYYPGTFLKALGPEPYQVAYVAPCRRPADGRYGENPYRFQYYYQYQVMLKPSPPDVQGLYINSLTALGIDVHAHDLRFVENNWEAPTLSTWGLGWEVWLDGLEITQLTYFQQVGGLACQVVPVEITYGLERIAMYLQGVSHAFDIVVASIPGGGHVTLGELRQEFEVQHCDYNFNHVNTALQRTLFDNFEEEARRLTETQLIYPAYEWMMKASHAFNLLDARGVLSPTERQTYVQRVRRLAEALAKAYLDAEDRSPTDAAHQALSGLETNTL